MKKKSLLAIGLSLSMVMATSIPALAANTNTNVNADGTEVSAPGHPDYAAGNVQAAGESFNEANITSKNGTDWATVNDDDKLAGAADVGGADINVWAKVTDSGSKIYKVDLAWGAMKFEYNSGSGQWNPATHSYDATGGTAAWTPGYLDGANNKVAVTNHSNKAINAGFAYAMSGTAFNDVATGNDAVIGNFFDANAKSVTAATVLTGTHTGGNVNDAAVADKLTGSKIALPTADAYNSTAGTGAAADTSNNQVAGARTDDVFFAFSGTPDKGKGVALDTFKKVGVITVTVTPNDDVELNRAPFVAVP